jgi:hypothetical protein
LRALATGFRRQEEIVLSTFPANRFGYVYAGEPLGGSDRMHLDAVA